MARKPVRKEGTMKGVRTSLDLPEDVWRAAKVRALNERRGFREIVIEALKLYLKTKKEGGR
jgi:hypothetical protein